MYGLNLDLFHHYLWQSLFKSSPVEGTILLDQSCEALDPSYFRLPTWTFRKAAAINDQGALPILVFVLAWILLPDARQSRTCITIHAFLTYFTQGVPCLDDDSAAKEPSV